MEVCNVLGRLPLASTYCVNTESVCVWESAKAPSACRPSWLSPCSPAAPGRLAAKQVARGDWVPATQRRCSPTLSHCLPSVILCPRPLSALLSNKTRRPFRYYGPCPRGRPSFFPVCLALLLLSSRTLPRPLSASFSIPPTRALSHTHFTHQPKLFASQLNIFHISNLLHNLRRTTYSTIYQFSQKKITYYISSRIWRCTTIHQTSRESTFRIAMHSISTTIVHLTL